MVEFQSAADTVTAFIAGFRMNDRRQLKQQAISKREAPRYLEVKYPTRLTIDSARVI